MGKNKPVSNKKDVDTVNSGKSTRKQERNERRLETQNRKELQVRKNKKINRLVGFGTFFAILSLISVTAGIKYESTTLSSVKSYSKLGRKHVVGAVKYAQTPPVGGNHSQEWLNCGIYTQPVPNENAVHSLEHSAVWVTYDPKIIAGSDLLVLQNEMLPAYTLLSPYPGISAPIVATAWGKQLKLKKVNDPKLLRFIQIYAHSPKAPEPGGECTGGLSSPGRVG